VAIDATAVALIDPARKAAKLPTLEKFTHWLESAATLGLGNHRSTEIELVKVGPPPPQ
jgi:hypothetical protein